MLILQNKKNGESIDLDKPRITVGRDASNLIALSDADISGFHAEFHCEDDDVFLVDLGSSNGTFVNGKPLNGRIRVKAWDAIRFASLEFELTDPQGRRPTQVNAAITEEDLASAARAGLSAQTQVSPAAGFKLVGANSTFTLKGEQIVGREDSCDITISDQAISRQHAKITVTGNTVKIEDTNSANGTYVNGQKITTTTLSTGDKVKFDTIEFTFEGPVDNNKTQVRAAVDPNKTQVRGAVDPNKTQTRPAVDANKTTVFKAPASCLKIVGGATPKTIPLDKNRYTLGRTDTNDIVLNTDSVSSSHALLEKVNDEWKLTDQGSTNGTYVNGKKTNLSLLKSGDKLRFGEVNCVFEDASATKSTATKAMPAATQTIASASKKQLPSWVYGVAGFFVVALVMGFMLFKDEVTPFLTGGSPAQIEAKLQAGKTWSVSLPQYHGVTATPALGDINDDGFLDIIVADQKGFVTALDGQEGKQIYQAELPGSINASVALADVTGDNKLDVIVATSEGIVRALDSKGQTLWTSDENLNLGDVVNKPAIADVDNDGVLDVIVPTKNKGLVALNGNRGWQIWNTAESINGSVITSPLSADLNGDGVVDIVSVTDRGQVMAISAQNDKAWQLWEADVGKVKYASPAFYDDGGLNLVIVATEKQGVAAIDASSGRVTWNVLEGNTFFSTPIISDANGDGIDDIIAISENGNVFVLSAQYGEDLNSGNVPGQFMSTNALYDINDDDIPELFMLDAKGSLVVTYTNRLRPSLQVKITGSDKVVASPLLGDINNDSMLDVIISSGNGVISAYSLNRTTRKGEAVVGEFLGRK
ncbi:FHA domain-containing protein [Alteromonas hispanica]|uniref:FHA domain-containing protein n=1 Tax=Alteromonas hispanica TaxID=315421 RepID=A0A6L9MSX9_9ALTE|nr:FHA domain-containing protein [Alteromonas hispanica]NDW21187.1 FHA domain-containing protein [Alteromonas hispanica]